MEGDKPKGNVKGAGGELRNVLSLAQQIRLIDLLRAKQAQLMERKPTLQQVADELGREAGFHITPVNMETIRVASGIAWEGGQRERRGRRVRPGTKARVRLLEKQVRLLCEKLGEPCILLKADYEDDGEELMDAA